MELFLYLLVAQALMGAFDTVYHHEFKVGLPRCPTAGTELRIHSIRAVFYALLFGGLALHEPSYVALWKTLDADPTVDEVVRNYPVRQPVLWV